ncbi:LCP family protein [Tessaracoccus antarcticus]|uniref:LytR family transcriptional regulator n=1 Tax=Tessaracoccus antarcticus TaxID=2479848 RepID=A0A3M0GHY6_9ACTN|nr:LCP family protein [Tessaracoccus antarcticus]RMB62272.1 LytR family transcriptional regulator [Tessaracoccus antarcticus]
MAGTLEDHRLAGDSPVKVDRSTEARSVRTRRALGLLLMSAAVPGSAQFVAGNRAVGRLAMRAWAAIWAVALVVLLGLWLLRGPTLAVLLNGPVTSGLRVGAWLAFAGWAILLLDAWRLARPTRLLRPTRLTLTASTLVLVIAAGFATSVAASAFTAANNVSEVLRGGGDSSQKDGRYNILLLGVDAAASRDGVRPDSINVASIDARTGRTVVFGLPRNLQGAPFPASSPLHEQYPDGFRCEDAACMLNGVYTLAEGNAELYPSGNAGLMATREVVSETLGLDINYYAMVDMGGFQSLINAMGGITLNVGRDVAIGGGGSAVSGYIEAGEGVHLDGYHALWFARSRHGSSDYERMNRQKCVMSAMAKQLDPAVVATKFVELSEAGKDIVLTDVGAGHVAELAELALKAKALELTSVDFTPPLIVTAHPDLPLIRSTVVDAINAAEALDHPDSTPEVSAASPQADRSAGPEPSDSASSPTVPTAAESAPTEGVEVSAETAEAPPICTVS